MSWSLQLFIPTLRDRLGYSIQSFRLDIIKNNRYAHIFKLVGNVAGLIMKNQMKK
jgi:hypothetical protein